MKRLIEGCLFLFPLLLLFRDTSPEEGLVFLAAILLHEGGHLAALFLSGYGIGEIGLSPGGISLKADSEFISYAKEARILLAGAGGNLVGMCLGLFLIRRGMTPLTLTFFFCNALFFLFNLLPVRGLDGYYALRALLLRSRDPDTAECILSFWSGLFFLFLLSAGACLMIKTRNPSLLFLSLMLLGEGQTKKATRLS